MGRGKYKTVNVKSVLYPEMNTLTIMRDVQKQKRQEGKGEAAK